MNFSRTFLSAACAAGAIAAHGAVTLFDFETPQEIACAPNGKNSSRSFAVESRYSTHGTNALHWTCTPWRQGLDEWPSFTLETSVADWTQYDRMAVDIVNLAEGGASFSTFIAGAEGRIQNGLHATTRLPSHGYMQWIVPLKKWPKTTNPKEIARVHFFTDKPFAFDVYLDRVTLLKPGESAPEPEGRGVSRDILPLMSARVAEAERECAAMRGEREHDESYWRFRNACTRAGQDTTRMCVGVASSMTKVRPRAAFSADPAVRAHIRLARREKESLQIIVAPGDADLKNVRVECSAMKNMEKGGWMLPTGSVACVVTGYVETSNQPPYKVGHAVSCKNAVGYCRKLEKPSLGWWPDPILEYLHATDVKGRDAQSFWVRVTCPADQPAGLYSGELVVSADNAPSVKVPFTVRVNGFSVPAKSPLPLAITFAPAPNTQLEQQGGLEAARRVRESPDSPVNVWSRHRLEWGDFLADYYITMDNLYHNDDGRGGQPRFDVLSRLNEQGRPGYFNLGYWGPMGTSANAEAEWRAKTLPRLKANWLRAKELGLEKYAYIYGCDEAPKHLFAQIRRSVEVLKAEFPGVPIFTTAYDHEYGVGTELGCMDWFTPLTPRFVPEKAAKARAEGRQVWWYICCGPHAPHANMFVEHEAIEGRLLMGAMTTRMRPDGFLYYQITIWNAMRPIEGPSAFTTWSARSWTTYHGDGSWTCCGPDGMPLATQRLENFRDGLEDYAYALELERRLKERGAVDPAWAAKARALLAVPKDVMDTMTNYTGDPAAVLRWRDAMADLIESRP